MIMQLQKDTISIQKQPSCEKGVQPQNARDVKSSGGAHTNSPELSLLKSLPLNYYHSHFLSATFDFASFFHPIIFGPHTFHSLIFFV